MKKQVLFTAALCALALAGTCTGQVTSMNTACYIPVSIQPITTDPDLETVELEKGEMTIASVGEKIISVTRIMDFNTPDDMEAVIEWVEDMEIIVPLIQNIGVLAIEPDQEDDDTIIPEDDDPETDEPETDE